MYIRGVSEIGRNYTYVVYGPKYREHFIQTSVLEKMFVWTSKPKKIIHISDFKTNGPRMTGMLLPLSKSHSWNVNLSQRMLEVSVLYCYT